jgi:hypothetical protein
MPATLEMPLNKGGGYACVGTLHNANSSNGGGPPGFPGRIGSRITLKSGDEGSDVTSCEKKDAAGTRSRGGHGLGPAASLVYLGRLTVVDVEATSTLLVKQSPCQIGPRTLL